MNIESVAQNSLSLATWYKFLSRWSLSFVIAYAGLVVGILAFVLPASQPSSLPAEYYELVAAGRVPTLYRLTITFDVGAWLALSGLFVAFAALLRTQAPIRSMFLTILAAGMLVGFLGACLRLAGTPQLAAQYLAESAQEQGLSVQLYDSLLRIINITFSAGGVLQGVAMLLIASATRYITSLPRWNTVLIVLTGCLTGAKGAIELAMGVDLGPLGLLAGITLSVALCSIALRWWGDTPDQKLPRKPQHDLEYRIKHGVNRFILMIAGKGLRSYSILKHIGRRSGQEYITPVSAYPLGDGFVFIMLNNGINCDWCQNVMAAGVCQLTTLGREYVLEKPEIISAAQALQAFPLASRVMMKARRLDQFLWVHHKSELA